jgi:CRP-like cAMP-binding protein
VERALEPHELEVFQGLAPAAPSDLLTRCLKCSFEPRQVVVRCTDADRDLFVLLRGYVEVTLPRARGAIPIATPGPGDVIGEVGHLLATGRTADVTALTDGELLRLPAEALDRLLDTHPAIAARVERNLARIMAKRLRTTSRWVTSAPPL